MRTGLFIGASLGLCWAAAASAQLRSATPAPVPSTPHVVITESLDLTQDRTRRMTVPVSIERRGPFNFIVDTGAERTVISRELAARLGLAPGPSAMLLSMTEQREIGTVVIPMLEVGRRSVSGINAPALPGQHLGAEGLLGVDALQSQRVELDFRRREITVTPSVRREREWPEESITVRARNRYGYLMLVNASLDGERVYVIIDTGSQVSVANEALRRRLARSGRLGPLQPLQLMSVTGGQIPADYGIARRITIGDVFIRNLPIAFADARPFHHLRLTRHPAILLGMDGLQLFDRVSVDFANRRVRILVPESSQRSDDSRLAS